MRQADVAEPLGEVVLAVSVVQAVKAAAELFIAAADAVVLLAHAA